MLRKIEREDLAKLQPKLWEEQNSGNWIKVGMSTCGIAAGASPVHQYFTDEIKKRGLDVKVKRTGCIGMCYAEPLVEINIEGAPRVMYGNVDEAKARELLKRHVLDKAPVAKWRAPGVEDLGFYDLPDVPSDGLQRRIVLRNCGVIDPASIEDYVGRDGYSALEKSLFDLGPAGVIEQIKIAELRGRGGAGFPTWLKWKFIHDAKSEEKFMICNADEGDPGAYMDRSVLEGDPHAVVEGMIIAGFASGCTSGFFYIRAEYPLAIERIESAIRQAKRAGLLGKNILGSGFDFDLDIRLGAGAFVCGEETALMASIMGRRGTPWPRPPFPAQKGLWGHPSNINNVETLANIAPIIVQGGEWYKAIGHGKSKGTKVFAVTGNVERSGLIEIPMGTTLRQVVMEIGGGVAGGRKVKAIQTGGPSGGVIPEQYFDTPISYETLLELGSIMGSGGMIVMDDRDSMIDIAKFYLGFCVEESCGKCAPCRVGGKQMLILLEKISEGRGEPGDIASLRRICLAMQKASLCGLGQTAPNPVLSTLRYFESEYTDKIPANQMAEA